MTGNGESGAQLRTAMAERRMGQGRGDRAQLAATLRWLRELKPVQRAPAGRPRAAPPA
jgi:hypothetical protein